jgi:hypothetical protein
VAKKDGADQAELDSSNTTAASTAAEAGAAKTGKYIPPHLRRKLQGLRAAGGAGSSSEGPAVLKGTRQTATAAAAAQQGVAAASQGAAAAKYGSTAAIQGAVAAAEVYDEDLDDLLALLGV